MHTITELGNSVPAFLGKLWKLVTDPETDDLICWSTNGKSFFIRNQARFARELLPHYYKHNNMASFVRQLNMYGFHKKVSVELGGLRCDRDEMEFAHQFFIRNQPYLLEHIKRKIASNKAQDPTQAPVKPELMTKVLTEVRNIRGRQEHFDTRLGSMKRENAALWKELAVLRQKHHKQQQIVNKLIHFLVTLVHPNRNSGIAVKRRYPLMIDDKQRVKQRKASKPHTSPAGPAIHELDASDPELDSEYIVAEMLDDQNPMVESPVHHGIVDDSVADETYDDDIINLSDEIIPDNNVNLFKKRNKGKKKGRKNKVPVKIFIPPSENEETPREEIIMLEVPEDNSKSSEDVAPKSTISCLKSIPVAPFKSSKLAAMVANMSSEEIDIDLDSLTEVAEDDSNVKLENVLKNPNIVTEENPAELLLSTIDNSNNEIQYENSNKNLASDLVNGSFSNYNIANSTSQNINNIAEKKESANFNIPKNLSLSCVNSNESERNYRQEVGDHLEITQSQLDNVQDLLKNDNYTFDANTILELFDNSDPMTYSFPVSPDLNPLSNMEKETNLNSETSPVNKRELMAYTNPNLLDYDVDNIFLGESSSPVTDVTGTVSYDNDPLDYDSKASLLDSLISNNGSTSHS